MKKLSPRDLMSSGMMRIMKESPFYTTILIKHEIVETNQFNAAMGTNGKTLFYNPDIISELSSDDIREIMKHEAMHVANRHHIRLAELEKTHKAKCDELGIDIHKLGNFAADLAINWLLNEECEKIWSKEGFFENTLLPGRAPYHEYPGNQTMEFYFRKILKKIDDMPPEEREKLRQQGNQGAGIPMEGSGGSGGGQEGEAQAFTGIDGDTGMGDIMPAQGDLSKVEQEFRETIARASMAAKAAGEKTGTAQKFITDYEAPAEVNWKTELQSFFTQIVRGRPHYRKPNRRHQSTDLIFPTNKTREVSNIVLMVDMSGSMSNEAVAAAYTHISEIIQVSQSTKLTFVPFDGDVFHDHVIVYDSSNVPIKESDRSRCGYGGTLFMPPLRYAEEKNPAGMIMLTDRLPSDTEPYESYRPKCPFIVLSVLEAQFGKNGYQGAVNPYAKNLEIKV